MTESFGPIGISFFQQGDPFLGPLKSFSTALQAQFFACPRRPQDIVSLRNSPFSISKPNRFIEVISGEILFKNA